MKTVIVFIALAFFSSFLFASGMQKYLYDTEVMIQRGKYKEALRRIEWFHNHVLEYEPDMYGVRLSYALSDWKTLGDVYPPALLSMKKTRDKGEKLLLDSEGNKALFHDVVSLNRALKEETKSISLFRKLHVDHNELAQKCWYIIKDIMVKYEDYDIVRQYIRDPLEEWEKIKSTNVRRKKFDLEYHSDASVVRFHRKIFIEDTIQLIKIAKKYNDIEAAKHIESEAKEMITSMSTFLK